MAAYFLDLSALIKRYVAEVGSAWVWTLTNPASGNRCRISTVTPVEVTAALYRRARAGSLTLSQAQQAQQQFAVELSSHYRVLVFSPVIIGRAIQLVSVHPLRAYDALQLAVALQLQQRRVGRGLSPAVFVSADQGLNQVALAEGMPVDDPNQHP